MTLEDCISATFARPSTARRVLFLALLAGIGIACAQRNVSEVTRRIVRDRAEQELVRPFGAFVCVDTAIAADTVYMPGEVDIPAMAPAAGVYPAYPPDLRNEHIQGEVIAQFIVNTAGCAEPASIRILAATNPGFVPNVQAALRRQRYVPARHRDKRVAQMVQQTFTFTLNY